jgi:uncharacterized membrane protein (GlpM family)
MLALKLVLVPTFLLLITLAGRRWGPEIAGWLAGLPVVAGPILFFLALAHGPQFAAQAATASLAAVLGTVTFNIAYSHAARGLHWPAALPIALAAWACAAFALSQIPALPIETARLVSLAIALATLLIGPYLFPAAGEQAPRHETGSVELVCRMLAGAASTVLVTWVSGALGESWSGLLAVFPTLGGVLAVFSHRSRGGVEAGTLLQAMLPGLYSLATFCLTLSLVLPGVGIAAGFGIAIVATVLMQVATRLDLVVALWHRMAGGGSTR